MAPCWVADPKRRPGFSDLQGALIRLGAVLNSADEARERASRASDNNDTVAVASVSTHRSSTGHPRTRDRTLLGPSVHHISKVIVPKVLSAVQPPWTDARGNTVDPPELATIKHAVEAVVKPTSAACKCPRDGAKGCAYVDTLKGAGHVGPSTALLSCEYKSATS